MTTEKSDEELSDVARQKLESNAFYIHFALYFATNTLLGVIWRFLGKGFPWFVYPLGIWGILVVLHLMMVTVFYSRRKPSARATKAIEKEAMRLKEKLGLEEKRNLKKGKN
jgi:hypothetical protein